MPDITYRKFDDIDGQRQSIYDYASRALSGKKLENATHSLELADVGYDDDYNPSFADEKEAILKQRSLHRPLKATLRLYDKNSGQLLDEQRQTIAHVPHLNSRGLFIRNGVTW